MHWTQIFNSIKTSDERSLKILESIILLLSSFSCIPSRFSFGRLLCPLSPVHVYQWPIIHFSWPLTDLYCGAAIKLESRWKVKAGNFPRSTLPCTFFMFYGELDFENNLNFNSLLLLIRCVSSALEFSLWRCINHKRREYFTKTNFSIVEL